MDYLAIPQTTASWFTGKSALIGALAVDLDKLVRDSALRTGVIAVGPIRAAGTPDGVVLALWNVDYLSGTGAESWGLVRLTSEYGLMDKPEMIREVLARELQVIDRRLQGLLLDSAWEIRTELDDVSTCIAGGGKAWRKHRIGYVEGDGLADNSTIKGVLIAGPAWEDNAFRTAILRENNTLGALLPCANSLLVNVTKRPTLEFSALTMAPLLVPRSPEPSVNDLVIPVSLPALESVAPDQVYETLAWTYDDWLSHERQLSSTQRVVLQQDIVERQPVRLVGAAGSGKTLLMMLLSILQLRKAASSKRSLRALYIAHNSAMRDNAASRLHNLGAEEYIESRGPQRLEVRTLFDYAREVLRIPDLLLIDRDADASKRYQRQLTLESIRQVFSNHRADVDDSPLLAQVSSEPELMDLFADLVGDEISVAIKGHGMTTASDPRQYVESEKRLSRLHGVLTVSERGLMWEVFLRYQEEIAQENGLLDADDLALSLLGRLRTPLWELRRPQEGYDIIFVDEAQLFNENEKRLFPLIAKRGSFVPMVIALDQAQQTRSLSSAGLGVFGVDDVSNQTLRTVHRCSADVLRLAFYIIQHTTDLFGADFPDFTSDTTSGRHQNGPSPRVQRGADESAAEIAARCVKELRQRNVRQIAVVCFAARYWNALRDELRSLKEPLREIEARGQSLPSGGQPLVVLARPDSIGGQEFDAVVCVGLEQGVVPIRVHGNDGLSAALEQQALREMYLAFTRARTELVIVVGRGAAPTSILQAAIRQKLLSDPTPST
ncbi:UvrD-helicase domain-containing protein [Sorangium atrum]|uniref:DNA 3'-5' helicase II n=1 Tax=Sorangium atrum TaxID=2995308 RepID=A0ABT5BZX6_9BACT|nr:UvrD-helicase domain-containing protein [Sorangium aterium]MDC0679708.1 UvrD-helicase domain-containing protein [Sorangium aterium]